MLTMILLLSFLHSPPPVYEAVEVKVTGMYLPAESNQPAVHVANNDFLLSYKYTKTPVPPLVRFDRVVVTGFLDCQEKAQPMTIHVTTIGAVPLGVTAP